MIWQPLNLTELCPPNSHLVACTSFGYLYLNLLVRLFGDSYDRRKQEELRKKGCCKRYEKNENNSEYDFIVVGAGSAGCIVANRLSEIEKWKVLLLEAGPEQPDVTLVPALSNVLQGSSADWKYSTEPDGISCLARPGGRCSCPRGKTMGGTSSINTMVYVRGNMADYDGWAALGNNGWCFKDVLPYFKKSERNLNMENENRKYHSVDGEQYIARFPYIDEPTRMMTNAFNEIGLPILDFNAEQQIGTNLGQAFTRGGMRMSTYSAFIKPIRYKRKNLTIRINSKVFKVLINDNNVAYGVKYRRNGTVYKAYARKEVILSAGAINSPQLLMLSGVGPKNHLEELNIHVKKNLAVGQNLQDHPTFNGFIIGLPNKTSTLVSHKEMIKKIKRYDKEDIKNGPLASNGLVMFVAFIKTDPDLAAPNMQYNVNSCGDLKDYLSDVVTYETVNIFPTTFYNCLILKPMHISPKSRGILYLNASNPYGPPLLFAKYFDDPSDIITILDGVKVLFKLEKTKAFKEKGAYFVRNLLKGCEQYEWGTDEYIICVIKYYTSSGYHQAGTCKMGPKSDKKAVLDSRLRVYGVCRLRVIDASMMPIVVRGNTNAPTMMIGEKGADLIKEDWLTDCDKI